jgi:hypothetical protein
MFRPNRSNFTVSTNWPFFLLLVLFVTMLFLYAELARFEDRTSYATAGSASRSSWRPTKSSIVRDPWHRTADRRV